VQNIMEMKIIDEQLEDKQQIVTYKYLTEKLNIHPNKAKQLLQDYVSQLTSSKKYSITIAIGGILQENNEFCIVIAYNDHVETMRRRFKQISFEHLYSIQPISRFDDINNALYLVDNSLNNKVPSSIKKKEKINICVQKQSNQIAIEMCAPSTKETNVISNEVLNHSNGKIDDIKNHKIQQKKAGLDFFVKSNKNVDTNVGLTDINVLPKKIITNSDVFSKFKKSNDSDNPNINSKTKALVQNYVKDNNEKTEVESLNQNVKKM